jgi:hypothetical protein
MLYLSEVLIQHPQLENFEQLLETITRRARETGELHFKIDVKPPYPDTPENWEDRLEGAFVGIHSITRSHY